MKLLITSLSLLSLLFFSAQTHAISNTITAANDSQQVVLTGGHLNLPNTQMNTGYYTSDGTFKGLSFVGWVMPTLVIKYGRVLELRAVASGRDAVLIMHGPTPTDMRYIVWVNNSPNAVDAANFFTQGEAVHIAVTHDSDNRVSIYKNGQLVASDQIVAPVNMDRTINAIAKRNRSGYKFNGKLDNLALFSRALSAAEVRLAMQGDFSTLKDDNEIMFYYDFEGASPLDDKSVNSFNAAPAGTITYTLFKTDEDVTLTIPQADLLSNDKLLSGAVPTFDSVQDFVGGSARINGTDIIFTPSPDFNGAGSFSYTISNTDGMTSQANVAINISAIDDALTISGTPPTTINEDTLYRFTPTVIDIDNDISTLTYSVSGNPDWLTINASTGLLSGTPSNGDVTSSTLAITVSVSDGVVMTSLTPFRLQVINVNDVPTISGTPITTVDEDTLYRFAPSADDVDVGDMLSYSGVGLPNWLSINASSGELSGMPTNDDVGVTGNIIISVTDNSGGQADLDGFKITVDNTNDNPTITGTPIGFIAEKSAYLFEPIAADIDVGDSITFSITNPPTWATFDASTGKLSGIPANEDVGVSEGIIIEVMDRHGEVAQLSAFNITVTNVNDAPILTAANFSLNENPAAHELVGSPLVVSDIDANSQFRFKILSGNDNDAFKINNQGQISVNHATEINYEMKSAYALVVQVSDGGLTNDATVNVAINDVVEISPLEITSIISTSVNENTQFNSPAVILIGLPIGHVSYSISGVDGDLFAVDVNTGELSLSAKDFELPVDSDGNNIYQVTLTVIDDDNNTASKTIAITIRNHNVIPIVISDTLITQIQPEDFNQLVLPFIVDDADKDRVTLSLINSAAAVVNASISEDKEQTYQQYENNEYQVTLTAIANAYGAANIQVIATDMYGLAGVQSFDLIIPAILDFPTISNERLTLNEDFLDYDLTLTNLDFTDQDSLTITVSLSNDQVIAAIPELVIANTQTHAVLVIKHLANQSGQTIATITVAAAGQTSVSKTILIVVNPVNDAPTISGTPLVVTELEPYSWLATFNDIDTDNSLLTFSANKLPSWAAINPQTGEIFGLPSVDDDGAAVEVVVNDGQLSTSMTVNLSAENVNQAPVASDQVWSIAENSAINTMVGALDVTDVDLDFLNYAILSGNGNNAFKLDNLGNLLVNDVSELDHEVNPLFTLNIRATDPDGLADDAVITITIEDINEAPTLMAANLSIAENSATGSLVGGPLTWDDIDKTNDISFSLLSGNVNHAFVIDNVGQIRVADVLQLNYQERVSYSLVVEITDGKLQATATVVIDVVDVIGAAQVEINNLLANSTGHTLTVEHYHQAAITGVSSENLSRVNIILAQVPISQLPLTQAQTQVLVEQANSLHIINQYSISEGVSNKPSRQDFINIGLENMRDEFLARMKHSLTLVPKTRTVTEVINLAQRTFNLDTDGDGLSDYIELMNGYDINDPDLPTLAGDKDDDNDGVSNAQEAYLALLGGQANPNTTLITDSDGDGLPDVLELTMLGGAPLDANIPVENGQQLQSNGLTLAIIDYLIQIELIEPNGQVNQYADFDNDGVSDALEVVLGGDPLIALDSDVDADSVADYLEAYLTGVINDNVDTKLIDLNSNGLSDAYEVRQAGTLKELQTLLLTQEMADSDNDGIPDAVELFLTSNNDASSITQKSDSDNDGVTDLDEIRVGTNPLKNDIPVLWVETTMLNTEQLQLATYFGGLAASNVTYQWDLSALTDASMQVSALNVKHPVITQLVAGLYFIEVKVTRWVNGQALSAAVDHLLKINDDKTLAFKDSDHDGLPDALDDDDANGLREEILLTNIVDRVPFKMITKNGLKLRMGTIAIMAQNSGTQVSESDIAQFGDGHGQAPKSDDVIDDKYNHFSIFDYEVVNLPAAGATISIYIPLTDAIPALAKLRKYSPAKGWQPFDNTSKDNYYSAKSATVGRCSNDKNAYSLGLTIGDNCLMIEITDGGSNDADGKINGMIKDPLAIVTLKIDHSESIKYKIVVSNKSSGSLYWLLLVLMVLGIYRVKTVRAI